MSGSHPGSPSPPRLNFLLHLDRDQPVEQAYSDAIELFRVAEDLGYDSGWVIQRHFRQGREHVSSPLPVLAAIAQHTTRIGLGTGVLVLPLEDPLRVAEDSATVDGIDGTSLETTCTVTAADEELDLPEVTWRVIGEIEEGGADLTVRNEG